MQLSYSTLGRWIPYKLAGSSYEMFCEWLYTGDAEFKDALFERTISICRALPENNGPQKNITSLSLMFEWAKKIDVPQPAAFIFHISRCGSTLAARMLAACDDTTILSEVPFFDDVLRTPGMQEYDEGNLLKDVIKIYSLPKNGAPKKVFIKTDSWHIMFYAEIRKMFPDVPMILLYRNPAEVVRSHNKSAGMHCVPQLIPPAFFGIQEEVITADDFYNYPIKVTEKYMQAFIDIASNDNNAFLFNYNQGMENIVREIGNITGTAFSETELQQVKEQRLYHSKFPGMFFTPEPEMQSSDEKFKEVFALYDLLEEIRIARS